MIALLDRLIAERSEYTYWMSQKSTDNLTNDSHWYYIEILKEVKPILASRMEPEAPTTPRADSPTPAKTVPSAPIQSPKLVLGKRKTSSPTLQGPNSEKAAKIGPSTSTTVPTKETTTRHPEPAQKQPSNPWRSTSYDNASGKNCALAAKTMTYAAAARLTAVV